MCIDAADPATKSIESRTLLLTYLDWGSDETHYLKAVEDPDGGGYTFEVERPQSGELFVLTNADVAALQQAVAQISLRSSTVATSTGAA